MDEKHLYDKAVGSEEPENIPELPAEQAAENAGAVATEAEERSNESALEGGNADAVSARNADGKRKPDTKEKRARPKRGEPEPDTDKDRLICAIASSVAALLSILCVILLGSSIVNMIDMMEGLENVERIIGIFASLLLAFGIGLCSFALSAIAYAFAKRANKGAEGKWKTPTLVLKAIPGVLALAVVVMLAVSVIAVL